MKNKRNSRRPSIFDFLISAEANVDTNKYCAKADLNNEASVENFFIIRLLKDLGYRDDEIKSKQSIAELTISHGRRKEPYKPDFVIVCSELPRWLIDAKATNENIDNWIDQCSGYAYALNRKYSGEKPLKYYAISNGLVLKVFRWDEIEPLLTLQFSDFFEDNQKFLALRSVLGASVVRRGWEKTERKVETVVLMRPPIEEVKRVFNLCHRLIWKSEKLGPQPAFFEFVKIMFVKLWEDKKLHQDPELGPLIEQERAIPKDRLVFSTQWIEALEQKSIENPINDHLFDRLVKTFKESVMKGAKKPIFEEKEKIRLQPGTIKQVVLRLENYDMFGIDEDLNGRLFETFLSATMRGEALGQYFTPRSIVKLIEKLAAPVANRNRVDKILDACCGTGGFLIEALTDMRQQVRSNASLSESEKSSLMDEIANNSLYGIDAGRDPPIARIARINMYLHGDGGSRIYAADALDKSLSISAREDQQAKLELEELKDLLLGNDEAPLRFDYILTNPPFSMGYSQNLPIESQILKQYALTTYGLEETKNTRPSLRSSVMFAERYSELLCPKGKLISVIDDTLLASSLFQYVRNFIRERFLIRAIISLPGDAFRRQGSRVKTSVLLLERKSDPKDKQASCFAYFSEALGVDDLAPKASSADVSEARAKAEKEIEQIVSEYNAYLEGKMSAHVLPPERLTDRLDLKYCAPDFGRMVKTWQTQGIDIRRLDQCVNLVEDVVLPSQHPDTEFALIRVSYGGKCELDKVKKGRNIRAKTMYRVKTGQIVFSSIRATDGAIGIVPLELDGALVSQTSYSVFNGGDIQDAAYLWAVLRSFEIRADMQSISTGSGRYTTRWPEIGQLLIPWLEENQRKAIGQELLDSWKMEHEVALKLNNALGRLSPLRLESEESKKRWKKSKAPQ